MENKFPVNPEVLLATLTELFAGEGATQEFIAILTDAQPQISHIHHVNYQGGIDYYRLELKVPALIYGQIYDECEACEEKILERVQLLLRPYQDDTRVDQVCITPVLRTDKNWRNKIRALPVGAGVSNQGRVRSDNIPPLTWEGLHFRSQPEIYLYQALKALEVPFAPLPVFIKGGKEYKRIEPDFVILKDRIVMVVEVDGGTTHRETPVKAHIRTKMLVHEGAHVERVEASECETLELATDCAKKLLKIIDKLKAAR